MIGKAVLATIILVMIAVGGIVSWHRYTTSVAAEEAALQKECDDARAEVARLGYAPNDGSALNVLIGACDDDGR